MGPTHGARQRLEPYAADGSEAEGAAARPRASSELLERLEERCSNLTVENSNLRGQVQALTQQLSTLRQELDDARAAAAGVRVAGIPRYSFPISEKLKGPILL